MKRVTLLFLFVLVAVLAFLYLRKEESRKEPGVHVFERALFPELNPQAVPGLRIDHLARSNQIHLERDAQGAWFLTDPIAYPALSALPQTLLDYLRRHRGIVVLDPDLAELGLDPPRAVVEFDEISDLGRVTHRVEIGKVDVDGKRVFVRVPGHPAAQPGEEALVLRAPRSLSTFLDRNPDDYRERRVTAIRPLEVVRFERRGTALQDGRTIELDFVAEQDGSRWIKPGEPRVTLDPDAAAILTRGACQMEVSKFVSDVPGNLAQFGLADPHVTIELVERSGQSTVLRLGYPGELTDTLEARWYASREGLGTVWAVDALAVARLLQPEELLYDYQILRAFREDVREVEWRQAGETMRISLEDGDWWVSAPDREPVTRFPASLGVLEDVLSRVERAQLDAFDPERPFRPGTEPTFLRIGTRDGSTWGGEIGEPARDASSGVEGRVFRRFGDEMTALIASEVSELTELGLDEVRRLKIHAVESQVDQVVLIAGEELSYQRREDDWFPKGSRVALPMGSAFFPVLERFANLKVESWLDDVEDLEWAPSVEVVLKGTFGPDRSFQVGRDGQGQVLVRLADGQHARLPEEDLEKIEALIR